MHDAEIEAAIQREAAKFVAEVIAIAECLDAWRGARLDAARDGECEA